MLKDEFIIWRLIIEKIASLYEIEKMWSLDDVLRANALLDMKMDLQEEQLRNQRKNDNR